MSFTFTDLYISISLFLFVIEVKTTYTCFLDLEYIVLLNHFNYNIHLKGLETLLINKRCSYFVLYISTKCCDISNESVISLLLQMYGHLQMGCEVTSLYFIFIYLPNGLTSLTHPNMMSRPVISLSVCFGVGNTLTLAVLCSFVLAGITLIKNSILISVSCILSSMMHHYCFRSKNFSGIKTSTSLTRLSKKFTIN